MRKGRCVTNPTTASSRPGRGFQLLHLLFNGPHCHNQIGIRGIGAKVRPGQEERAPTEHANEPE